jgi:hypothetical protein
MVQKNKIQKRNNSRANEVGLNCQRIGNLWEKLNFLPYDPTKISMRFDIMKAITCL